MKRIIQENGGKFTQFLWLRRKLLLHFITWGKDVWFPKQETTEELAFTARVYESSSLVNHHCEGSPLPHTRCVILQTKLLGQKKAELLTLQGAVASSPLSLASCHYDPAISCLTSWSHIFFLEEGNSIISCEIKWDW